MKNVHITADQSVLSFTVDTVVSAHEETNAVQVAAASLVDFLEVKNSITLPKGNYVVKAVIVVTAAEEPEE